MTSHFEDEVVAFMKTSKANVSQNRQAIEGNIQGMKTLNATMEELLAQVKQLTAARGAAPDAAAAAAGAAAAVAAGGGQGAPGLLDAGVQERALRGMRRSLSHIPRFSGDKTGPTFRQHVEAVRTHNSVYEVTNEKIAKSGLLMSLTVPRAA